MTLHDTIGFAAAALTTGSFVPQAVLTLRTRDVSGISLSMYSAFTVGVAMWLAYGLSLGDWPIVVANAVTLVLALTILITKIVVDRQQRPSTRAP
jgi:MtN3 and saliva related transmembrane protein